jgi:uncharacterized protein (TIGR02611 family)
MIKTLKKIKRIIIAVFGFSILAIGLMLIFLPGPAFIIIPMGLAILATEFMWARNILHVVKEKLKGKRQSTRIK